MDVFQKLRKESSSVDVAEGPYITVDKLLIEKTVYQAKLAPSKRARVLLHPHIDDSLHEMLIALPRTSCDVPHINFKSGKSFHVLYGQMVIMMFSSDGTSVTPVRLKPGLSNGKCMIRLNSPIWHTIIPLSSYVVFIETIIGPFTHNKYAKWVPRMANGELNNKFIEKLRVVANEYDEANTEVTIYLEGLNEN